VAQNLVGNKLMAFGTLPLVLGKQATALAKNQLHKDSGIYEIAKIIQRIYFNDLQDRMACW
jgi:hypothetical protein